MDDTVWLEDWRAFYECGQLVEALLDRRLKDEFGISHSEYGALRRLLDAENHRLSMLELRHQVWFSRSRLTHQINRLIRDGWVAKASDGEDRRRQLVTLSPAGLTKTLAAQVVVRGALTEHFFGQFGHASTDLKMFMPVVEHLRTLPECQLFRNS